MSGIWEIKKTNNKSGINGKIILHFVLSTFPKGIIKKEKNNPDTTVNNIYSL
jgi:hypothetical protein